MRRQTIILFGLLFGISGWLLWARLPSTLHVAAGEIFAATSPLSSTSPLRPAATPSAPLEIEDSWPTYTHPIWGITFRYPAGWEVEGPESIDDSTQTQEPRDNVAALGRTIILSPESGNSWRQVTIRLEEYTLSSAGSLAEWVTLRNEWSESRGILTDPLHLFTLPAEYVPSDIDEALYSIREDEYSEIHALWFAKEGIVYSIRPYYSQPEDIALIYQLASSLEFDPDQQGTLHELVEFAGDEEALRQFNESRRDGQAAPNDSPLAPTTPIAQSTRTPRQVPVIPEPTATPRAFVTVTPSTFESPLVNGLQQYQGNPFFENLPPFEVRYDPTQWQLAESPNEGMVLLHQQIRGCVFHLTGLPQGAIPLAQTELADYEWGIFVTEASTLGYSMKMGNSNYIFNVTLPASVPTPYDPESKSRCEQHAEAVIDTFAILDTPRF